MSREGGAGPLDIGAALKDARRRIGIDIAEAEERTKIRARYLRALEGEDWEALPAPAYVRGFLRTYGAVLGLDGEMLADQFRRRYEAPAASASPASEPILGRPRGGGSRPPSRGPLIAAVALGLLLLLFLLFLLGRGDDPAEPDGGGRQPTKATRQKAEKKLGKPSSGKSGALEPVDLRVEPLSSVQVCLVGDSKDALIVSQVLAEGSAEDFSGETSYRLDLQSGGTVKLEVGKETMKLGGNSPASFEADENGIREIDYAGPDCP